MPSKKHSIIVHANAKKVWDFVRSMNNWAPLVPGYISHHILNEKVSTWEFKIDMGLFKKKVEMEVTILEWKEPSKVTFNLVGINEHFEGNGYFLVEIQDGIETKMTGYLEINSTGTFPTLTNNLMEPKLEEMAEELTEAVRTAIENLP
ncbi:SRPBCC family protein [Niallia sp.]|uniref:CoxG family protein n=1 Tax=Niallia sp. TaxID=2837523 RepID=UPI002899B6E1|nr:SRPBCC family protein [Niallia sp.]